MIRVGIDEEIESLREAANVAESGEVLLVNRGGFMQRVEIKKPNITIIGAGPDDTILDFAFSANLPCRGKKLGTFRSYTMLVNADNFTCKNMTIKNSSGFGSKVGQAIAVYAEGNNILFENCRITGHQDTLFTGPLPEQEYEEGGFIGPTEFAPRVQGKQIYKNCFISGEVDFIFGSAEAYFDGCEIFSYDCGKEINGYVTAASTYEGRETGYVFNNCRFTSDCPENSVYLGRPWRDFAKTVFINCEFGAHIRDEGFHDWNKENARKNSFYAVYNCTKNGKPYTPTAPFARTITEEYAEKLIKQMNELYGELNKDKS